MAPRKITKTSSSALVETRSSAPEASPAIFTRVSIPPQQMDEIRRQILESISSERVEDYPTGQDDSEAGNEGDSIGNSFSWNASQINTDLGVAAHCEIQGDFFIRLGDEWHDLIRSPMYWELRQTFVRQSLASENDAFMNAVIRAYHAGRACPDRLEEDSKAQRQARRIQRQLQEREARTGKAA